MLRRAGGSIGRIGRRFIGTIIPSSGPTVTNVSALGAAPVVLSASDTGYDAGARIQWEFDDSLTPPKNAASGPDPNGGSYVTPTQKGVTFIDGDSWARLDLALGYTTPGGAYAFHFRVLVDNENGLTTVTDQLGQTSTYDAGPWSNDFTDTISAVTAALSTVSGTEKHANIFVTAPLTYEPSSSTNSAMCVRMDRAQANDGWHAEYEIVTINAAGGGNGNLDFGVCEGPTAPSFAAALAGFPGNTGSGLNGFTFLVVNGNTNLRLRRNGGSSDIALPGGTAIAVGDRIIIEYKHSTKRLDSWFYRAATGITTAMHVNVVLTSQIPNSVYLFGTAYRLTDKATFHLDPAQFQRAATAGYTYYA